MKKTLTKLFRQNLKALMLVMMTSFFAFSATGQETTVNSSTDGPYYPYQGYGADYEAVDFPAGTTYYLYVDINENGMVDNEDVVLAQSTDATDSIGGTLTKSLTDASWDIEIAGTNGEDLPSPDALGSENLGSGDFITQNGTSFPLVFDQDGPRNAITAMINLDYDFVYFGVYVDADTISAPNEIVFSYSQDGGDNYVDLEDIGGLASLSDTVGYFYYQLPQAALTDTTILRISQNSSGTLVGDMQAFQISGLDIEISDTESIQFGNDNVDNIYVNDPTFEFANIVEADTVGEGFGTDYEAFGFTTGATFYMYTTQNLIFIDDEDYPILNGDIYDMSTATSGTFEGTFPLEESSDYEVRVAGVYGNLETPFVEFEGNQVTALGSDDSDYWFRFDQNGVRSIRTNAVDLSAETVGVLNIKFTYTGFWLEAEQMLRVQYSVNGGSSWVSIDSLYDTYPANVHSFVIPEEAFTSSVQFRVRQNTVNNGSNYVWEVEEVYIRQFEVAADEEVDSFELNNWALVLNDVLDDEGGSIGNYGTVNPGDSITLQLQAYGFDPADSAFAVYFRGDNTDGNYLLDDQEVTVEDDMITIAGFVPKDIEYNDDHGLELEIRMYEGDASEVSFGYSYDLYYDSEEDDFEEDDFIIVGGEQDGSEIEFALGGDRSYTTPAFSIPTLDGFSIEFNLERGNSIRSSAGTEVVLEYSTDGTTYTTIETYGLNDFGSDGKDYEIDGADLPAGVASGSTSFRWRQLSNSGSGLDKWEIDDANIQADNNIVDLDYLDYPDEDEDDELYFYINTPSLSIGEVVDGGADLYPGTEFTVAFTIEDGEFPDGTEVTLYLDRENFPIILDTQDAAAEGTFTATVPSIVSGVYSLNASASYEGVTSGSTVLAVIGVQINEVDITSADAVQDGEDEVIYPGATVDISYNVVGPISSEVTATLLVWDNDEEEYVVLISGEDADGTISAELPLGINYGEENDVEFQLQLVNGNLENVYVVEAQGNWDDNYEDYSSYYLNDYGTYATFLSNTSEGSIYLETISYDLTDFTTASIYLKLSAYDDFNGVPVRIQYSTDEGETWVTITERDVDYEAYDADELFPDFIEIPEEAMTADVSFRWIYNEDGEENYGGLRYDGFQIQAIQLDPISDAEFTLNDFDIYLQPLTISMANLEEAEYQLGEEFSVTYNADGPFPSNVTFAVVLNQDVVTADPSPSFDNYVILGESNVSGINSITVNFPSYIFGDPDNTYELSVEPYVKAFDDDIFRPSEVETTLEEEDFVVVKGRADIALAAIIGPSFTFNKIGERSLRTREMDLTATDTATLSFNFTYCGDEPSTVLVLPLLQVTTDGGVTFDTLRVEGSSFAEAGYLYNSGTYDVGIPAEYLTETTQFRWFQALNRGTDENKWTLSGISVSEGESNSLSSNLYQRGPFNPQDVYALVPDLDDYVWEQSDPNDAVFNGETFEYLWTIDSTKLEATTFPEGTVFEFTLSEEDPSTGEDVVIASSTTYGVQEATIPFFITQDEYSIYLTAWVEIEGEDDPYVFFDEELVGSVDVFNRAVRTTYTGADDLATLYAGSTVEFSVDIENNESSAALEDLTANLILDYDGDDWLLASQTGLDNFVVDLPSFVNGTVDFRVELSEDGAIGTVGEIINDEESDLTDIDNDADNFLAGSVGGTVVFATSTGRRVITTRDFSGEELADTELLQFYFSFDKLSEDLTVDQHIVFEYSIDEGSTYVQLDTFPTPGGDELAADDFRYSVASDWKTDGVRFRWRQNEAKGSASIDNMDFLYAETLPFDYISTSVSISKQALAITSINQASICLGDEITIDYDIKGKFGAMVELEVYWSDDENEESGWIDQVYEAVSSGSGSVTFEVPTDGIEPGDNNGDYNFYIRITDYTFIDVIEDDYSSSSPYSDERLEVVAPIAQDLSFSWSNPLECESEDVILSVDPDDGDLQNGFMFEALNVADNSVLGFFVYDDELEENTINIGQLDEDISIKLRVTSMNSAGESCNTFTYTDADTIKIQATYKLFRRDYDGTSVRLEVQSGESKTICDGSHLVQLDVSRIGDVSNSGSNLEWFRDNVSTPVSFTGTVLGDNEDLISGNYFVRVTDGECVYNTDTMTVEVIEAPVKPTVTLVSNSLACGEGEVVLAAPTGYSYYMWDLSGVGILDETSDTLVVEEGGRYRVRVSNYPMDGDCGGSPYSDYITIEKRNYEELVATTSDLTSGVIVEGQDLVGCGDLTVRFYMMDGAYGSGTVSLYKDGAFYSNYSNASWLYRDFVVEESGAYHAEWTGLAVDNTCTSSTVTFNVTINEEVEEQPMITASGDISFCEGGSVTLSAPTGYPFYRWYNDGTVVGSGETLEVAEDGEYEVRVANVAFGNGCGSPYSEVVDVTVYEEQDLMIGYANSTHASYQYEDGDEIEVCSSDNFTLYVNNETTSGVTYTWYRDGVAIPNANSTSRKVTASGTFHAEVSYGVDDVELAAPCVYTTPSVVVNFNQKPAAVSIAEPANVDFCAGEINLTLTADAGAAFYNWYHNGSLMFDEPSTSNTLMINDGGTYSVTVETGDIGCESARSNIITIDERAKANPNINVYTDGSDCATGDVTVYLSSTNSSTVYQLINRETGADIGSPVVGSSGTNVYTTLSGLTEPVALLVEASYTDGSGCSDVSSAARGTATPNGVILVLDGTEITAEVSATGSYELSWYRNGTLMRNATSNTINVVDAATYSVEVTFDDGCTVTSSTVDVGAGAPAAGRTASNGRIVANTFPNPSTDFVNVEVPGEHFGVYQVQIMTLSGQVVISGEFTKEQESYVERIDISNLEKGIYNMMVVKGKQVENIRIVKQ